MSDSRVKFRRLSRAALLGATGLLGLMACAAAAQDATPATTATAPAADDTNTVVVVTGYRASLQNSTQAKRRAVGFQDSIFAEDMGKFPDTNLAESFNRIPGVVIAREIDGEGTTLSIRGLGPSFSRVLLNGAAVATASTGDVNTNDSNREVDLDIFPPELFTQLTVYKTPSASQVEGGAAGTVDMRQARPFDFKGDRLQFSVEGSKNDLASKAGWKGSLVASKRFGNWGILFGAARQKSQINVEGFESVGWTNPNLSAAMNPASTLNATGGGNWTIPGTVPAGAGNGLNTGDPIDQAFLLAQNPGVTIDAIDNGIIPRLGRPMHYYGDRDRTSGILSLEYKSDTFHFWLDTMAAQKDNDQQRTDMNFVGRNGSFIPLNMKVDRSDCTNGCVVTDATYANAQFFLEYRPWFEKGQFHRHQPGLRVEDQRHADLDLQRQLHAQPLPPRFADRAGRHQAEFRRDGDLHQHRRQSGDHVQRRSQQSRQLPVGRRPRQSAIRRTPDPDARSPHRPEVGHLGAQRPGRPCLRRHPARNHALRQQPGLAERDLRRQSQRQPGRPQLEPGLPGPEHQHARRLPRPIPATAPSIPPARPARSPTPVR
ncbi:MAG: TonB-dependent receptor plug domain-containing protein, partial [Asticcacaulis sp.]